MKNRPKINLLTLIYLVLSFFRPISTLNADNIDWRECPKLKIKDMVEAVLEVTGGVQNKTTCYEAGKLGVVLEERFKGELTLVGKRNFSTLPIFSTDDTGILRLFRETELFLLDSLGTPRYFHKQGVQVNDSNTLLLFIKRGKIEYRSVWNVKHRNLTLLLSGEKSALILSLGWD